MFCLAKNTPPVRVEAFVPTDSEDGFPEARVKRTYKQIEQVPFAAARRICCLLLHVARQNPKLWRLVRSPNP